MGTVIAVEQHDVAIGIVHQTFLHEIVDIHVQLFLFHKYICR